MEIAKAIHANDPAFKNLSDEDRAAIYDFTTNRPPGTNSLNDTSISGKDFSDPDPGAVKSHNSSTAAHAQVPADKRPLSGGDANNGMSHQPRTNDHTIPLPPSPETRGQQAEAGQETTPPKMDPALVTTMAQTATSNGHTIYSNDGHTWYDAQGNWVP
jgi:hypothetical protein